MTSATNTQTGSPFATFTRPYLIFLFSYMMMYSFFDTYTTSYYSVVVSFIQADFGIDHSQWYSIMAVASLGMFAVLVIQYLTDVVGRKPMMMVVFFGMGFASLILFMSKTVTGFTVGFFLLWMFFSSDIWVILMAEEAPKEKRARYTYLVSFFGALGAIAIPISRDIFITSEASTDPSLWRGMTYLAMAAIPISLLGLRMKETSAFKQRKTLHQSEKKGGGFGKLKEPFAAETRMRVIAFMIIGFVFGLSTAAYSTLEAYLSEFIKDVNVITNIFYIATIGTLVFFGITGILADKIGRKVVLILYVAINFTMLLLIVLAAPSLVEGGNIIPIYIIAFLMNGSFWGAFLMSKTFCVECFPTNIRGTSSGWRSFCYAFGIASGALLSSALAKSLSLGTIYLIFSGIGMVIIPILVKRFLPETRGLEIVDV